MTISMKEILRVAKELALEDELVWKDLDEAVRHSYQHYAAVVIRKRPQTQEKIAKDIPESPSDKCSKCGGKGFTEKEHGLVMVFCDCEKGQELRAEMTGQPLPSTIEDFIKEKPEVIPAGQYWCTKCHTLHREASNIGKRHLKHQDK